ncbi:sel1 repeat family protein [Helicobacter saguini]|uniref:Beta-lactamase n=1 Tax=Helicobacter saguini TaxID=1548018 RepID=A0A347VHM7_9HELI|nr:tetratricopeptide repeat protein [Helicobacter saguini]MWV62353.1 sel1 repeat family protein [Helicobacter saguini]MWV66976.1 sel1 repeat family protein [Helicobacter saguini]MWV69324.1 sel1 repeat family protein [Helicobacter saguini]MWV71121.1 sel1 repeat family protein [Helicobacter saguini]TLD94985.1 sel1 repeat family protein [Helicobacter saguini]
MFARFCVILFCVCVLSAEDSASLSDDKEDTKVSYTLQEVEQMCENKNASACASLGLEYLYGLSLKQDVKKALDYMQKACDGGFAPSCGTLSVMYEKGTADPYLSDMPTIKKDLKKAFKFAQKGCDLNNIGMCARLGEYYANGEVVAKDSKKSKEFFKKACDLGYKEICNKGE